MWQMSDFFGNLNVGAIKNPDSQFNVGPLPSTASGPAGSDGDPDGKYNFNGSLLSGITPYAYGKADRMGSDRNYQQIPHRVQQIVCQLFLPHADMKQDVLVPVSHSVDQGDVAFIVKSRRKHQILYDANLQQDASLQRQQMPNRNAFCNFLTVNYLLAGLQRLSPDESYLQNKTNPWSRLAIALDFDWKTTGEKRLSEVLKLCRFTFLPYGICAGSENQGGKHETGMAPVQAAVNHVTTMTVDGQNRDLVNYWRRTDIDAGDQLIFRLQWLPTQTFTLNHYYKGTVHQRFPTADFCWQMVPDVYRMSHNPQVFEGLKLSSTPDAVYDYRRHGFWRIGQTFQHRGSSDISCSNYSDDTCFLRGQLLQITFAPMWYQYENTNDHTKQNNETSHSIESGTVLQTFKKILPNKRNNAEISDWNPFRKVTQVHVDSNLVVEKAQPTMKLFKTTSKAPKTMLSSTGASTSMISLSSIFEETNSYLVSSNVDTLTATSDSTDNHDNSRNEASKSKQVKVRKQKISS